MVGRVQREEFEPESAVWFEDGKSKYLVPGIVIEETEDSVIVHSHGKTYDVPFESVHPREETGPDGVHDLILLPEVHEGAVLHNMKKRYQQGQIYTYLGQMLYAINPYQTLQMYDLDTARTYHEQLLGKLPAHIFGIANATYYNMLKCKQNQIIIISGEGGSGKTESRKIIQQYFTSSFSKKSSLKLEQVIESNRILESFGHAKTVINNNSSRFGTFTEMIFENGNLCGSKTQDFLLEKTRVTFQNPGGRNFHVFYELLAGLPVADRKELGLLHGEDFFYLNQGSNQKVPNKDDYDDFQLLLGALEVLEVTMEERKGIICLLGGILHLGNIYYGKSQQNGREVAVIVNHAELESVAKLLQINVKAIAEALTQKVTKTTGDVFHQYCNVEEALDSRDTLAQTFYTKLFAWLLNRINQKCSPKDENNRQLTVGLLDLCGFEEFEVNGFEQFAINFTEEVLHAFSMRMLLEFEQDEYELEGIPFDRLEDMNTQQDCSIMLIGEPSGIVNVLRDVCNHPQPSDRLFLDQIHQEHGSNPAYDIPKIRGSEFGIRHYAGYVNYHVDLFVEKNCAPIHPDAFNLAMSSKLSFISELFPDWVESSNLHVRKSAVNIPTGAQPKAQQALKSAQEKQMLASHQEKLQQLLEKIKQVNPIFVRCIRPNTEQVPGHFQDNYVTLQMEYFSTLDTIAITKSGYTVKSQHDMFTRRYKCLYNQGTISMNDPYENSVRLIMQSMVSEYPEAAEEFKIGQTLVMMKVSFELFLEELRFQKLHTNAIIIQKTFKAWYGQKKFLQKLDAAITLQSFIRCHAQRNRYQRVVKTVIMLQSIYRRTKYKRRYGKSRMNEVNRVHARQREHLSDVDISERTHYDDEETDVTRFDIPADLAAVFSRLQVWEPLHIDHNICAVNGVTPWEYCEDSLPKDLNLCLFSKFIRQNFQKTTDYSHSLVPIKTSLLRMKNINSSESIKIFKLILRFMEDNSVQGLRQLIIGNYIVNKGILYPDIRDEIFSHLCKQLFKNPHHESSVRGWLLMGLCLCVYPPSQRMYKFLLKYISDYAYEGYSKYLQKKLLSWKKESTGRMYSPTLIEWKALKENAHLCFECRMSDGYNRVIEVVSSSICEDVAKSFLSVRKKEDLDISGWSFYLQYERLVMDALGCETFLDLISVLEQPPGFPYATASTTLSLDRTNRVPTGHMEIAMEAHKQIKNRTMLDRLQHVLKHGGHVPQEPILFQPIDRVYKKHHFTSYEDTSLTEALGFQPFNKQFVNQVVEQSVVKPVPKDEIPDEIKDVGEALPNETIYIKDHPEVRSPTAVAQFVPAEPITHVPQSLQQINQHANIQKDYQVYNVYRTENNDAALHEHLRKQRQMEVDKLNKDLMDIERMELERARLLKEKEEALLRLNQKPPPVPPPPPPILPSVSNPQSIFPSRGNTIIRPKPKVRKKTPWSMDEVLQKHKQLRPRVEQRYHTSHSEDPMLDDSNKGIFEKQLYEKIIDIKQTQPERYIDDVNTNAKRPDFRKAKPFKEPPARNYADIDRSINKEEKPFKPRPGRKFIDIEIEPTKNENDELQKILQNQKSGLRKSHTKNVQEEKEVELERDKMQRNRANFDIKNLLENSNVGGLTTSGSSNAPKQYGNSDEILKSQMGKLRAVQRSIPATNDSTPTNNEVDYKSVLKDSNKPVRHFPKHTMVSMTDDFRAATNSPQGTLCRKNRESPSILGKSGGSLSRQSKERLEKHGKRYEMARKPPDQMSMERRTSVSSFVDNLFKPVFADNDLTSNDSLTEKLKGGPDFYPNRTSRNSLQSSIRSSSPLVEQLLQQEQQIHDSLQKARTEKKSTFDLYSQNTTYAPPPTQTTTPWVRVAAKDNGNYERDLSKSIRHLPAGIHKYIHGFDELVQKKVDEASHGRVLHPPPIAGLSNSFPPPQPPPPPPVSNIPIPPSLPPSAITNYLSRTQKGRYLSYQNTKWKILLKKEIFYPNEKLTTFLKALIYRQILEDLNSRTCARLSNDDCYKIQRILDASTTSENDVVRETLIDKAKQLPLYFSRIFKFSGYDDHLYNYLAVSHSGLRFAIRDTLDDRLRPVLQIPYLDVIDVRVKNDEIHLDTTFKLFSLHTRLAKEIKKLINIFVKATSNQQRYVKVISGFIAPSSDYLSLKKGNIIRVFNKKDIDQGCMWGVLNGVHGMFPSSCVEEYDNSSVSLAGWLPSVISMYQKYVDFTEEDYEEQYTLIDFALRFFKPLPTSDGVRSEDGDDPDTRYLVSMTQFKKEPISGALINFNNKALSRQASDVNRGIMKFMGDLRRDQNETDMELVYFILKSGRENLDLRDEIFCQIIRQLTFNSSDNRESCSRGWKLMMLCTSYFDCSRLVRPYINKYLQSSAEKHKEFNGAATVCETNLGRSFKYSGRKHLPSQNELAMILQGKHCKYQNVHLPGNHEKLCKINTSSTVAVVVKDVCEELDLPLIEEHEEYGLYVYLHDKKVFLPVENNEYLFDIFLNLEKDRYKQFSLVFRKQVWFQGMRFANNLFTKVIYDQILPDVMNGYLLHHKGNRASNVRDQQTQNEVSLFAALQHRVNNKHQPPTVHEVAKLIPDIVASLLTPEQWMHLVQEHFVLVRHFTAMNARIKFLELLSAWYYFGSSFFYVTSCSHPAITDKCVLAVNKNGVQFLAPSQRDTLLAFNYKEIISTRYFSNEKSTAFVDFRCGNLMSQRSIRLETPRGKEISNVVQKYMDSVSKALKPKETIMNYVYD